ncbi:MAG: (2Fe-2S) ferredoxin domain-containing protein [Kofleriaceae bacterium]|nr:MAG: (2Fe-2S) ferredoxin domain-containing protein [Kofleriaceae bacterium]MBZ0236002.1 (2Fe-2S) ferredoxin domain-containing protein [Kofleriaceae bacterium]
MPERRFRIIVCRGPECGDRRNSRAVHEAFARQIAAQDLGGRCQLDWQSCFGRCSQGPNVLVRELPAAEAPRPRFAFADLPPSRGGGPRLATALYNRMDPVKVVEVVARHVIQGAVVGRFIERPDATVLSSPPPPPGEPDV